MAYSLSSTVFPRSLNSTLARLPPSPLSSKAALSFPSSYSHFHRATRLFVGLQLETGFRKNSKFKKVKLKCSAKEPLRVMISGAPASGKGTQCQMIVQKMVKTRLSLDDAKNKGWLLDGYPRSAEQAQSLEDLGVRPDIYIVLEVPDDVLIDRCVGRRLDPVTGKIYHINNLPPETEEIKARLVTRPDDTEEKEEIKRKAWLNLV